LVVVVAVLVHLTQAVKAVAVYSQQLLQLAVALVVAVEHLV
jgi:hypothetical protein